MKIKSASELDILDERINIFNEPDWDFITGLDSQAENYEYFNDIRDTSFDRGRVNPVVFLLGGFLLFLVVVIFIAYRVSGLSNDRGYVNALGITSGRSASTSYIDGSDASGDAYAGVSELVSKYFNVLNSRGNYKSLYSLCTATSTYADTYGSKLKNVKSSFDHADSFCRLFREYGSLVGLMKVNKVILNNGIYYCYIGVSFPTSDNIREYAQANAINLTKEFQSYIPTEAGIVKYWLELMSKQRVGSEPTELLLKVRYVDNAYQIIDDSVFASICIDAYSSSISYVTEILGTKLTSY